MSVCKMNLVGRVLTVPANEAFDLPLDDMLVTRPGSLIDDPDTLSPGREGSRECVEYSVGGGGSPSNGLVKELYCVRVSCCEFGERDERRLWEEGDAKGSSAAEGI